MAELALRRKTEIPQDWLIAAAGATATVLLIGGGFAVGAPFVLLCLGAVGCAVAIAQPRWGLYLAVIIAFTIPSFADQPSLAETLGRVQAPVDGLWFMPLELIVLCSLLGVLRRRFLSSEAVPIRAGDLWLPLIIFVATIGVALAYGLSRGGDRDVALWETRGLFMLAPLYFVGANTLVTREHFEEFGRIVVVAILAMSLEVLYRHFFQLRDATELDRALDLTFKHESSIFAATLVLYLLIRSLWGSTPGRTTLCVLAMLVPLTALMVMKRRAGMVALDIGLLMLGIALLRDSFLRFLIIVPLAIIATSALLVVTWHEPGGLGQPARSFRAITEDDSTADDKASDDFRDRETGNVRANILARPIQGLGFGHQYAFPNDLPDLSSFWPFFRYIPHNSVLWIWMKGGILAFGALLLLFGCAVARAGELFRRYQRDPMRTVPLAAGGSIVMFAAFAYVDLGLATTSAVFLFGLALGVLGAMSEYEKRDQLLRTRTAEAML